jgi:hypothetical protein
LIIQSNVIEARHSQADRECVTGQVVFEREIIFEIEKEIFFEIEIERRQKA